MLVEIVPVGRVFVDVRESNTGNATMSEIFSMEGTDSPLNKAEQKSLYESSNDMNTE